MPNEDRRDLVAQMKARALFYREIHAVLTEELGEARAEALLTRAIQRRGRAMGAAFARFGPDDLDGLRKAFLGGLPGGEALFSPQVLDGGADALEIQLHACPLKEAWQEAGVAPQEMATLCRIAGAVDKGLFEAAGFRLENRTWTPGAEGCCFLRVLPG